MIKKHKVPGKVHNRGSVLIAVNFYVAQFAFRRQFINLPKRGFSPVPP